MSKNRTTGREYLKYEFSEAELLEIGKQLGRSSQELETLEDNKKAVTSQLKAQIDGKQAEVSGLSNKMNSGCEYRYIDTRIEYNHPSPGIKTTIRNDTGAIIRTEVMSDDEKQLELDFEKEQKEREESRRTFAKENALENDIEESEYNLPEAEWNQLIEKLMPQSDMNAEVEKKTKKGAKAS